MSTCPHAAVSRADKLAGVRAAMQALGASHHFISSVDDIAWLLNLRGSDVDYNPVFLAHLLLSPGRPALRGRRQGGRRPGCALAADGIALAPTPRRPMRPARATGQRRIAAGPAPLHPGPGARQCRATTKVGADQPSTLAKSRKTALEAARCARPWCRTAWPCAGVLCRV